MTRPPEDAEAAIPPYEGRKESAETGTDTRKDGARTAGATAPVTDDEMKSADPRDTERGAVASPADEQPAAEGHDGESSEKGTGPSHEPGTGRAEDQPAQ